MKWETNTSAEIAALDKTTPVVLSIAAIEQHGPHLALETDAVIGGHFLDRLDAELGDAVLILPQVKVGCSEHHMDFPGTLSVGHEAFILYVSDIVTSVARHGFRNIVILNSHGGNQAVGGLLLEKLGAMHRDCRVAFFTWWRLAAPELTAIRESAPGGLGHACEFETSVMLSAKPEDVRRQKIGGFSCAQTFDWDAGDMLLGGRGTLLRTMAEKTNGTGVLGDPSLASAAKGEAITAAVVDQLAKVVKSLAAAGPKPMTHPVIG
ncbi:creatininase family protein [Acuticoccus sp. M5D2P5]|uniref:creatininase family protein n=1 Tax=Acuticoccus kalidii TaxID=2910977 RepID=UPI001F318749|nr:creatininase family protein [Acuticoccus kalidii]MCF3936213.1 creatininase family protein [Acuticoccus kalidii]